MDPLSHSGKGVGGGGGPKVKVVLGDADIKAVIATVLVDADAVKLPRMGQDQSSRIQMVSSAFRDEVASAGEADIKLAFPVHMQKMIVLRRKDRLVLMEKGKALSVLPTAEGGCEFHRHSPFVLIVSYKERKVKRFCQKNHEILQKSSIFMEIFMIKWKHATQRGPAPTAGLS